MENKYYDSNKRVRNYLKSLGFKYEKIQKHPDVSTFRFKITPQLEAALREYSKLNPKTYND